MGQAGCGKSLVSSRVRASSPPQSPKKKFINSAANKDELSNDGVDACTEPQHTIFTISSRRFTLIETPGFNNTKLRPSDSDILVQTAELMKK